MADEDFRDGELSDDEVAVADLLAGEQHSAFADDEELNNQLPVEDDGDERTALTAAHQGSRATSLPSDNSGAFTPSTDADLLDEPSQRTGTRTVSASRSFDDALSEIPPDAIQDGLSLDQPAADGAAAQDAHEGGSAPQGERTPTSSESENPGSLDAQLIDNAVTPQDGPIASGQNTNPTDISPVNTVSPGDAAPGSASASDFLGGSGDQTDPTSAGSSDDGPEEIIESDDTQPVVATSQEEQDGGQDDQGDGGVNPITGDRFDNNLAGTDGRDMINAMDGDDAASGGAGDDLIMGKKGDDTLEGGLGDDTLEGGHGDDVFLFTDADFDGSGWTDVVDGQGQNGNPASDYDVVDLSNVTQGWTLEVDGAGAGAEATNLSNPSEYAEGGAEFSGTITFDDGSTIAFDNIEKIDW